MMPANPEQSQPKADQTGAATPTQATVLQDRIQIEFLIEDLAKQLIIDRGRLVANGCNGCNSCS
jgi:hypothetical protein